MASSPPFKVYRNGEYVASCKFAEDAAAIVGMSGGQIKLHHKQILFDSAKDSIDAGDSWDAVASLVISRLPGEG